MKQGDNRSSRRRLYFDRDQLFYYTESAERRATANQASHAVDKVELRLAFDDPNRRLTSARTTVNDKPARSGQFEAAGALNYAASLRQAAEETATQVGAPAVSFEPWAPEVRAVRHLDNSADLGLPPLGLGGRSSRTPAC